MPHLAKADEEIEDVGVVVDHSSSLDVGIKLGLALSVQRLIEVCFPLVKFVLAQHNGPADGICSCHQTLGDGAGAHECLECYQSTGKVHVKVLGNLRVRRHGLLGPCWASHCL